MDESPSPPWSNTISYSSQHDDGRLAAATVPPLVPTKRKRTISNRRQLLSVEHRIKRQRTEADDVTAIVRSMMQSLDSLANTFSAKSNEETGMIRAEIREIKKEVNDTKKSIYDIKSLLVPFIITNKHT